MNDSRIEKLLKAILGQEVQLEPRESRVERLLYAILTGGSHDEPTLSEMEDILLCILHGEHYDGPTNSRINALLKVKANGGSYDEPRLSRIEELIFEWINGGDISTYMGTLPATLQTVAGFLESYKMWGNTGGVGVETENLFSSSFTASYNINTNGEVVPYTKGNSRCATLTPVDVSGVNTVTFSYISTSSGDAKRFIYAVFNGNTLVSREASKMSGDSINVSQGNKLYLCIYSNDENIDSSQTITNIMLNLGSTALPYEPFGYKLPILSNDTATDIYIGDTQLAKDEYVDGETGQIYRYVDGALVPTDPPAPLPLIPTAAGETTISYGGAGVQPEKVELKYRK